jgi:hypothetical protein
MQEIVCPRYKASFPDKRQLWRFMMEGDTKEGIAA